MDDANQRVDYRFVRASDGGQTARRKALTTRISFPDASLVAELLVPASIPMPMRIFVIVLMMLLLPLQGWLGDAMAMQMATDQLQHKPDTSQQSENAITSIATNDHRTGGEGHSHAKKAESDAIAHTALQPAAPTGHDCAEPAIGSAEDTSQASHNTSDCGSCPSCQACHTVALGHGAHSGSPGFNPTARLGTAISPFASADAALSQKPPIS